MKNEEGEDVSTIEIKNILENLDWQNKEPFSRPSPF